MLSQPANDGETEEPAKPTEFFWVVTPEDFDEEGNLNLEINTGRLRHRWVPSSKSSARAYIRDHPHAEGLRSRGNLQLIVKIFAFEVEDVTELYPQAMLEGMKGKVIKTPLSIVMPVLNKRERSYPSYSLGRTDFINVEPPLEVASMQHGILTEDEIEAMSVMQVISAETMDPADPKSRTPVPDGIHDLRMGALYESPTCETCGLGRHPLDATRSCPGHFGHIDLSVPVPKFLYLGKDGSKASRSAPLLYTLNRVCHSCSKIPLPDEKLDEIKSQVQTLIETGMANANGFTKIRQLYNPLFEGTGSTCPHCGEYTPRFEFTHYLARFYTPFPTIDYKSGSNSIDYAGVYTIFNDISDETARLLGFNPPHSHPRDLFFKKLPVIPNQARPILEIPGNPLPQIDGLTRLYQDVLAIDEQLRSATNRGIASSIRRNTQALYHAVSRVTDNLNKTIGSGGDKKMRTASGAEKTESFKGILNRLSGKKGRFRANLQSKYVEEVGYSAVAPNGALAIDEVGVPISVCMRSTVEEIVDKENIDRLKDAVINGASVYPGALSIYLDGDRTNYDGSNQKTMKEGSLEIREKWADLMTYGTLVKRHIIKGDIGLFNRAPSLHRQSIMAVTVIPMDQKNFSFNATICDPFNADYDGDAMKLHFLQTPEAIEEAKKYMYIDKNIIHARHGKMAIANDQDQVSGTYLLTHTDLRRRNEWNKSTGLGFTDEGIPYVAKRIAIEMYSHVFYKDRKSGEKVFLTSLPESDYTSPTGEKCYTGRALFSHLFTVIDAEYVSAVFTGVTPITEEKDGEVVIKRVNEKPVYETIEIINGKLIKGTLEKGAFGTQESSIAPAFFYHEGYEAAYEKLCHFIELATRLGLAAHRGIGFSLGLADVSGGKVANKEIDKNFIETAKEIQFIQEAYESRQLIQDVAVGRQEKIDADRDPLGFMEEKIQDITSNFEKGVLRPVQDYQGAGNAMQISVRSKARGKDSNVQQMGGSYGLVSLSGQRVRAGINPNRVLPHYPMDPEESTNPVYSGFIRSSYSMGMQPTEYWMTSTGGRRSTVESGMGNISTSGYLERKLIKGMESYVVDKDLRTVSLRSGLVISPIAGEDGLKAYHSRGNDPKVNKSGKIITLQPMLYDFKCKHGLFLESASQEGSCPDCTKGSDTSHFRKTISAEAKSDRIKPSEKTIRSIEKILEVREVTKPNVGKMAKKLVKYYRDSLSRPGEAIGAVAAACLGEPATQAALRTFHFAGKASFQGSIDRLKQILESPAAESSKIKDPRTIIRLKEGISKERAETIADVIRPVKANRVVDLISYDLTSGSITVSFLWNKFDMYGISKEVLFNQLKRSLQNYPVTIMNTTLDYNGILVIAMESNRPEEYLLCKERIMNTMINGIGNTEYSVYFREADQDEIDLDGYTKRYTIDIRNSSNDLLEKLELFNEEIDFQYTDTTNLGWIYNKFGLEAVLMEIADSIYFQMNGGPGAKGIGEYDYRYCRTIADSMGEYGELRKLGPSGSAGKGNPSMLGGCSLEQQFAIIQGASMMGNYDPINGVAESIVVGNTVKIGDYVPSDQ